MQTAFAIEGRRVGPDHPVFVVAEIGINHGGDAEQCARLIEAAAAAGADAVKLQTLDPDESYVEGTVSYREFKGKELGDDAFGSLVALAKRLGVTLFSTPGDLVSLERLMRFDIPVLKISSGLMTNSPLVAAAARYGVPLIISTGMGYEHEIASAVETARANGAGGVALLKCTALYPAPDETLNLRAIPVLAERFGLPVGYSDHSPDRVACLAAVALGATIIEKHFTLDRGLPGADHFLSLEPRAFADLVSDIRRVECMMGTPALVPTDGEKAVRAERHRCLVARRSIQVGDVFSPDNVALKRPRPGRVGLPAATFEAVVGKSAAKPLQKDDVITADDVAT